ncbi:hypothetical protein [Mycoplasma bradburyae]|uniref:Uncharacterized protein n=1 Tax=Mycoplasma bradburyae TaxID=2963128 RepID=A0AAW6HNV3_9MOLU|nr:hypothetical protein [Mycoplasma bradburyae]MDC4183364.1 hypothetical protein [Mycoplasma bradburyae]
MSLSDVIDNSSLNNSEKTFIKENIKLNLEKNETISSRISLSFSTENNYWDFNFQKGKYEKEVVNNIFDNIDNKAYSIRNDLNNAIQSLDFANAIISPFVSFIKFNIVSALAGLGINILFFLIKTPINNNLSRITSFLERSTKSRIKSIDYISSYSKYWYKKYIINELRSLKHSSPNIFWFKEVFTNEELNNYINEINWL